MLKQAIRVAVSNSRNSVGKKIQGFVINHSMNINTKKQRSITRHVKTKNKRQRSRNFVANMSLNMVMEQKAERH